MDESEGTLELLIFLVLAVPWVITLFWIYGDARRWNEDPLKWTVLACLFGPFVLPFYLSSRQAGKRLCACGRYYPVGLPNCPHCGREPER